MKVEPMFDRLPVRYRLSVAHALWMLLLFTGVGFGLFKIVKDDLYDSVDAALMASAKSVRDARYNKDELDRPIQYFFKHFFSNPVDLDRYFGERHIRQYAQLINMSGKVQSKTDNLRVALPVTPLAIERAEQGEVTFETLELKGNTRLRQVTLPVLSGGDFTGELIQVGASLTNTESTLGSILTVLWIGLPLGLLVSVILGYILAARALKPVKQMTIAASSLGIDDLGFRIALPRANDELKDLAYTFNGMLTRLDESVKRLRRFTGDVSHELRTPLAVILGEAELALRRPRSEQEYKSSLSRVVTEGRHMKGIIDDLLLLAKAEGGSVSVDWVAIDAQSFLAQLKESVSNVFDSRGLTLETRCEGVGEIIASQGYLTLALKNLLINAAKHSAENGVVVCSVFKLEPGKIIFAVEDFGEGIEASKLNDIFDPFYRIDTARNRASGGAGIGLSLTKALVKLHQGDIKVKSVVGEGTVFQVVLPILHAESEPKEIAKPGIAITKRLKIRSSADEKLQALAKLVQDA